MAGVHILSDLFRRHSGGLDLINDYRASLIGKNAVSPALKGKSDVLCLPLYGEKYLSLIAVSGSFCNLRWMWAPSSARSNPVNRLSMLPVRSRNSTSCRMGR